MHIDRTGLILYTIDYTACVEFYSKVLQLPTLFKTDDLTCFELGKTYLMVEKDDEKQDDTADSKRIKTCIRINVPDVKKAIENLTEHSISVDYQEHNWGIIAKFFDPDGNLIAFKDSYRFEKQIEDHTS